MSQNPYEIRLSLLGMAKEMLEQEYFSKMDAVNQKYAFELEAAQRKGISIPDREGVQFPTEEDIIAKAKKLNNFVSNG